MSHIAKGKRSRQDVQGNRRYIYFIIIDLAFVTSSRMLIIACHNNSYHSSIDMAPFEALYGRRCRTPLCWYKSGESLVIGPEIVQQTTEKIKLIQQKL